MKHVVAGKADLENKSIEQLISNMDAIPQDILSNPAQGANLDQRWVRVRRT